MTKRLVVIDGMSVFYRGYYALPNLSTKDGTPTGGVYGFAVMALEIVKRLKPDYVCVAWDKSGTNARSRRAIYPEYKAGRKTPPPDFFEQVPILHQLLEALGWPLYEMDDYEADDIIGAFAKQAGQKGVETYVVTSDLDVLQLVNPHTHIYTLKKGFSNIELFNETSFREKYGVEAHQFIDVKALKGDASDNIPGVAGVGEKTALQLIAEYKTLDGVYENIDLLKPTLRTKLEAGREMAYLSKKLVTLMVDAPIELDLNHAKLNEGVTPRFVAMMRKLEFRTLQRQAEAAMPIHHVPVAEEPASTLPTAELTPFKADDFANDQPRVLALNPDASELWISQEPGKYAAVLAENLTAGIMKDLASGPIIGHDLKSVFKAFLARDLIWPSGHVGHDTRIGAFLLDSLLRSRALDDLLGQELDLEQGNQVIPATWNIYQQQKEQFAAEPEIVKFAETIEFPMIYLLAKIEHRGILLDSERLNQMGEELAKKIGALERRIYAQANTEFNIGSPSQLAKILYEDLGLPTTGIKKGKTGFSTGAVELAKLRELHPIIDFISQYRELTKLKNTYVDVLPQMVDDQGRLHTTFALDIAATGRLSSSNPNLQNIPTRTEIGQAIRTAFVPAPGNVFVSADYSQFELRLAAMMADDQEMIEDFNQDADIHTKTAAEVYNVPPEQVTKDMRRNAKVVNFGILYGMSPRGLSVATTMNFNQAKEFIDKYFALRPAIRRYMDQTVEKAMEKGYTSTLFGRRRPSQDLKSSNFAVREGAKRAVINMPIQGTEADLMKMAMLQAEQKLDGLGQQILQIHDSIMVECPAGNAEKVAQILKEVMENIHKLPVKLKVDVKTGQNWGEL